MENCWNKFLNFELKTKNKKKIAGACFFDNGFVKPIKHVITDDS